MPPQLSVDVLLISTLPSGSNTMQLKFVTNSANSAGSAAAAGDIEKDLKYEAVVHNGALFFPLTVETYASWTPSSLDTIN